jgi:hypothetical protein
VAVRCLSPVSDIGDSPIFSPSPSPDPEMEPQNKNDHSSEQLDKISPPSEHQRLEKSVSEFPSDSVKPRSKNNGDDKSLSPVSDKEVEILEELDQAEKRSLFRKERQRRVNAFNADLKLMMEALDKQKKIWVDDPDKHCDYEREWQKFWTKKSTELRAKGLDARNFDMTPEWTLVWKAYFEQDLQARVQKERDILMRKHKLLSRDLVIDADFSKPPPGVSVSPNHSIISSSGSLSILDQEEGDKSRDGITVGNQRSGSRSSQAGRTEERCSSPWEDEEPLPSKQVNIKS